MRTMAAPSTLGDRTTMNHHAPAARALSLVALVPVLACTSAWAEHVVDAIPLAPHGDAIDYNGGVLPLTPMTFVVGTRGVDGQRGTADDKLLIVTGVGATPTTTDIVVGGLPTAGARWTRLSATRALYQTSGADGVWSTGDEELVLVDGIGSTNSVSRLVVGSLQNQQGGMHVPVRLSPDTAVVPVLGADDSTGTDDDMIVVLTDLGGTPVATPLPAPFLDVGGRTQPTALSPTSFLVASSGPDGAPSTADDLLYLFTDVGGANTRTEIPLPNLHEYRPGRPVRLSATRAVVMSEGPDGRYSTADDRIYVVDGIGTSNAVSFATLPFISCCGATRPTALGPDLAVVPTFGADGIQGTADDTLAFVSDLGGANTVTPVVVGGMDEDRSCRPLRLAADRVAVVTNGPDAVDNSADDRIAIVSGVGGAVTVVYADVPGLDRGGASEPLALSSTALLLLSGGPDGMAAGGLDDVFTVVSGVDTTSPTVESVAMGVLGGPLNSGGLASRPALVGHGRAFAMGAGADARPGTGGDDAVHVIDGLPRGDDLSVKKLQIKFKAAKPQKGASFKVTADLVLADPSLFGTEDTTISIGNAAQTIPAAAFVLKKGKQTYTRPRRGSGFITKVVYDPRKGTLSVVGKGVGTGGETTAADNVPFTVDTNDGEDGILVGETLVGTVTKAGLRYKKD